MFYSLTVTKHSCTSAVFNTAKSPGCCNHSKKTFDSNFCNTRITGWSSFGFLLISSYLDIAEQKIHLCVLATSDFQLRLGVTTEVSRAHLLQSFRQTIFQLQVTGNTPDSEHLFFEDRKGRISTLHLAIHQLTIQTLIRQ